MIRFFRRIWDSLRHQINLKEPKSVMVTVKANDGRLTSVKLTEDTDLRYTNKK